MRVPGLVEEVVSFGLTGAFGLLVNVAVLSALVEFGHVSEALAAVLSTATVLFGTFVLTDQWVFDEYETQSDATSWLRRAGSYYGVMITAKGLNYLVYLLLLRLGVQYQFAWVSGSMIVFVGTFGANRFLWISRFGGT